MGLGNQEDEEERFGDLDRRQVLSPPLRGCFSVGPVLSDASVAASSSGGCYDRKKSDNPSPPTLEKKK